MRRLLITLLLLGAAPAQAGEDDASFLLDAGESALVAGDAALAAVCFSALAFARIQEGYPQGAVVEALERIDVGESPSSLPALAGPAMVRLAETFAVLGEPALAGAWMRLAAAAGVAGAAERAVGLASAPDHGVVLDLPVAEAQAKEAMRRAARLPAANRAAAAPLLWAALELHPDGPAYPELVATLDKLGRGMDASAAAHHVLIRRPGGVHAAAARRRSPVSGTLAVSASFPCERLLVNGTPYPTKGALAVQLTLPVGTHRVACLLPKVRYAEEREATVFADGLTVVAFSFAVFVNELDPWGRVLVNLPAPAPATQPSSAPATQPSSAPATRPNAEGALVDLGPFPEIAVALPPDGREVRLLRRSGDGERTREIRMDLLPGQKYILRW